MEFQVNHYMTTKNRLLVIHNKDRVKVFCLDGTTAVAELNPITNVVNIDFIGDDWQTQDEMLAKIKSWFNVNP